MAHFRLWFAVVGVLWFVACAFAGTTPTGTGFTYQGLLKSDGELVSGNIDIRARLFDAVTGPAQVGSQLELLNIAVTDGVFTVELDFGTAFGSEARWLEIDVKLSSDPPASYQTLSPRQRLMNAPMSLFSLETGFTPDASLAGTYTQQLNLNNVNNTFTGNGAALTNLNASRLVSGTVPEGVLAGVYSNTVLFSNSLNVLNGTHSGSGAGLTLLNASNISSGTLNIARLPSGGAWTLSSSLNLDANTLVVDAPNNRVGIGTATPLQALHIAGNVYVSSGWIGSTNGLELRDEGVRVALFDKSVNIDGSINVVLGNGNNSVTGTGGAIGGGGSDASPNFVYDAFGTIGGGTGNVAGDLGGLLNRYATVGGGQENTAGGYASTIAGGALNTSLGTHSSVSGGLANSASGAAATVPGGNNNLAGGNYSFAAGRRAIARDSTMSGDGDGDQGAFVWADSTDADFVSTGPNQFLVRAAGGVGINTNAPAADFDVDGVVRGTNPGDSPTGSYMEFSSPSGHLGLIMARGDGAGAVLRRWDMLVHSDSSLRFTDRTASADRVTILTNGNVGLGTSSPTNRLTVSGNANVTGTLSKGGGSFMIDHPLDPENKFLYHSFVESPDMMNVYNGNVVTDIDGYATIILPEWFEALNRDFRYQLTVIDSGDSNTFAMAKVVREIADNEFIIRSSQPLTKVSWQVTGIRHDPFAEANRIPVEADKPVNQKGKYLHPEAYQKSADRGMYFAGE